MFTVIYVEGLKAFECISNIRYLGVQNAFF